ncbi:MAG: hypothetical protein PVG07_02540 [Acidobacteriota bacterium]
MAAAERTQPGAHLIHHVEGRTRLRLPEYRGETERLERLAESLGSVQGVEAVTANPVTGSVLVYHRLNGPEELEDVARERGLFDLRRPAKRPLLSRRLGERVQARAGQAERWIERESRGEVDLPGFTFVLLLFASFYQALQGRALPAGVTLLNYALKMVPAFPASKAGSDGGWDDNSDGDGDDGDD